MVGHNAVPADGGSRSGNVTLRRARAEGRRRQGEQSDVTHHGIIPPLAKVYSGVVRPSRNHLSGRNRHNRRKKNVAVTQGKPL